MIKGVINMNNVVEEAKRCLRCKKPMCKSYCPVSTPINEVIDTMFEKGIYDAGKILFENNPLSAVCALVCPHEKQCKGNCILGKKSYPINFGEIEHYISLYYLDKLKIENPIDENKKLAIIGSGPAGITLAFLLVQKGYDITIFEAHDKIGGVLRYGIPEFRLPKSILEKMEIKLVEAGVKIRPNTLVGPVITLEDLFRDGYKAIFIGTGVWNPNKMRIKGETLGNVHYAIDYLKNPEVYRLGKKVCVIGAGNVAMDVARTIVRTSSADVTIMYRKGKEDMPAREHEIEYTHLDGVEFEFFKSPIEFTSKGVRYEETKYEDVDGEKKFVTIPNSEDFFQCDSIVVAISQGPKANIVSNSKGIEVNKKGLVIVDDCGRTTKEGVFSSGDVVTGAKTVVEAVKHSKKVAEAIDEYVMDIMSKN
ncbi:dihydropyrimidine dehydrogenase [Anaeromicrobium sediminis]|uniref:Dihydropyrimidine dehydrogenase n=2 Tax=Anaeromicrobium sediminis TaxID=1478221 RepID=A0A267MFT4_9FIRM|nr:dihydropyrimidine dehydrogenase [Anaeromicrobium sediminis]